MRILYLSPRESWPANSGAKLRDFHLARCLAQTAEVTYLFFGGATVFGGVTAAEALHGTAVPPPRTYTPFKILRGLLGREPLPLLNYQSPEMERAIAGLSTESFDLIHLDSIHMAGYLPQLRKAWPRAKIALDWHNIESEGMQRFAASTRSLARRLYAKQTAARLRTVEDHLLKTLDGHLVCSEREQDILLRRAPEANIAVIENGVDVAQFQPSPEPSSHRIVFVGQMSYRPNAEGAIWFVNEIWPELRKRFADLSLFIVGADPTPGVRSLSSQPGVTVTGTVPDVRQFYGGALAAIVPLRAGAGTRLKILEAMAAETPVISTRLGAEGLDVQAGVHLFIAENVADWIRAIEEVQRSQQIAAAAKQLVIKRYDWSVIGQKLCATYGQWIERARR